MRTNTHSPRAAHTAAPATNDTDSYGACGVCGDPTSATGLCYACDVYGVMITTSGTGRVDLSWIPCLLDLRHTDIDYKMLCVA